MAGSHGFYKVPVPQKTTLGGENASFLVRLYFALTMKGSEWREPRGVLSGLLSTSTIGIFNVESIALLIVARNQIT